MEGCDVKNVSIDLRYTYTFRNDLVVYFILYQMIHVSSSQYQITIVKVLRLKITTQI